MNTPAVSIILPTYNRAKFLPEAIGAIRSQLFSDWELIVVDDGSVDETRVVVENLAAVLPNSLKYVYQDNQGAAGARNTGLNHASGEFVAFFDSDDLWMPNHLQECFSVLRDHSDVDWVYAASQFIETTSGKVLSENCFYHSDGEPLPFLRVPALERGAARLLPNAAAAKLAICDTLMCGLQTSLIRSEVFRNRRIPRFRVGEDQVLVARALADGVRIAYINSIHLIYRKHSDNVSVSPMKDSSANIASRRELVRAFEWLAQDLRGDRELFREANKRAAKERFWGVGYELQRCGNYQAARAEYWQAIRGWPYAAAQWKTLLGSYVHQLAEAVNRSSVAIQREAAS